MSTYRYLLSTGEATTKAEEYIIDLFRLYLTLYPGDIPHYKRLGFDFLLTNVTKENLKSDISLKVNQLIGKIQDILPNKKYTISVNTLDLIDEETVKLVIDVDGTLSEDIFINLYDDTV